MNQRYFEALDYCRGETGQNKATDFEPLWGIFAEHIRDLPRFTLVIDGLDECENRLTLLECIIRLLRNSNAKVIVFSRREPDLTRQLDAFPQIKFGSPQNHSDISSFLQFEISKNDKLKDSSVEERFLKQYGCNLVEELSTRSEGSFLWARSVLKELQCKATTSEILAAVEVLPSGLIPYYKSILEGYNRRFDPIKRRLCCMILRWLVCASRPLTGEELLAALTSEYLHPTSESDADDDLSSDTNDKFHFSRREVEELCGALVNVDDGLVQLAHISIADFLRDNPFNVKGNEPVHDFFVDFDEANLRLTMVCVGYLRNVLGHPAIKKEDRGRQLRLDLNDKSHTFLPYSVGQWLFHLIQSGKANLDAVRKRLERFLLGPDMLYWLEMWFSIEGQNLWTLQIQIEKSMSWYATPQARGLPESIIASLLCRWSRSILQLLERHGPTLQELPSEIHFIDPQSYDDLEGTDSVFAEYKAPNPPVHTPHFQLQSQLLPCSAGGSDVANPRNKLRLPRYDSYPSRTFYVDLPRYVLFMAIDNTCHPELRCQSLDTGQMLKPLSLLRKFSDSRRIFCEAFTISPNGRFMALLCRSVLWQGETAKHISYDINIWELPEVVDFDDRNGEDWCKLVDAIWYEGFSMKPSPQPMLIDAKNALHCPVGRMNITHLSPPLPARKISEPASIRQLRIPDEFVGMQQMVFSGDLHYMIAYDPKTKMLNRYITEGMSFQSGVYISASHMTICSVSRTGNLVVWADMSTEHRKYFLLEFSQELSIALPGSEDIMFPHHGSLKFSADEGCLLGIMGNWKNHDSTYIASWTFLSTEIKQTRSEVVWTITGLHFMAVGSPAYCACGDRWLQFDPLRLDLLGSQLHSSRYKSSYVRTEVSNDGNSLALLSVTVQRCVPDSHPCPSLLIMHCIY